MKTIKKVAVTPIPEINGSVVDTFNVEDKTTNAPSIRAVEEDLIKTITNENGTAIKFHDGTMICHCRKTFTGVAINQTSSAMPYVSTPLSFNNFPVEFIDIPSVNISVEGTVSAIVVNTTASTKTAPYSFSLGRYSSLAERDFTVSYQAKGRWK